MSLFCFFIPSFNFSRVSATYFAIFGRGILKIIINTLRTLAYLAICVLVGYYNFQLSGWIGIATNILYLVVGIMLAETWLRNRSETLENLYSNETNIDVQSVGDPVKMD